MNARDDVVLTLTEDDDMVGRGWKEEVRLRRIALACHFGARSLSLIIYLFCSWLTSAFIAPVVCILTLFAIDFWIVKNVSGRLLVGLRWWNQIDEAGKSHWLFESDRGKKGLDVDGVPMTRNEMKNKDSAKYAGRLFWIGLFVFPLVWVLLFLVAIFSLKLAWALVAMSGCVSCLVNLYGYLRCRFKGTSISPAPTTLGNLWQARTVIHDLWGGEDQEPLFGRDKSNESKPQQPVQNV